MKGIVSLPVGNHKSFENDFEVFTLSVKMLFLKISTPALSMLLEAFKRLIINPRRNITHLKLSQQTFLIPFTTSWYGNAKGHLGLRRRKRKQKTNPESEQKPFPLFVFNHELCLKGKVVAVRRIHSLHH